MSTLKTDLVVAPQEIYTISSTQGTDLGARVTTGDGRYFRYVLAGGTTLVAGKLQQSPAEDTTNFQNLAIAAASTNAVAVTTTTTVTVTANQLAGGLLVVTQTPGQGFTYKIKSHAAATGAAVTFNLEDPIQVALTTASKIDTHPSIFNGVILNPTTASSTPVGAAVSNITNAQYGWIQTKGPCAVLAQGTIVVGEQVASSSTTAGCVVATSGVLSNVGFACTGIASADYGLIYLLLD